jgi:guanylate cyclase
VTAPSAPGPIDRLAAIGFAPGDDADTRIQKGTLTLTATSILVLATAWTATYLALDRPLAAAIPFTYQAAALVSLVLLARTKRYDVFRGLHIVLMLLLPVLLQWVLGGYVNGSAVIVWAFVAPLGALVFVGSRAAIVTFAAFVGLVVLSGVFDAWLAARAAPLPEAVVVAFFVLDILGVSLVTFLVLIYFVRQRQRAVDDLAAEQARSESLLRNILPVAVAQRLKRGERIIADRYEAVTVLFVDVVGFTPLAQDMAPDALVELLDRIFRELDGLSERHGLVKIKTVGDAYIAVAGLPTPMDAEAGAVAAAEMALEAFAAVARAAGEEVPLRLRVGLHTGPVVAGVIGRRTFAYDLWGDAVNVASRMESQGLADRIQVSLSTYELLQHRYRFRFRGTIDIKGHGEMAAYFLLGPREG